MYNAFTYFICSGQFVQTQNGYGTLQVCHCNYTEVLIVLCMQQFDEKMYRCIQHIYTNSIIKLARDKWIDCLNSHDCACTQDTKYNGNSVWLLLGFIVHSWTTASNPFENSCSNTHCEDCHDTSKDLWPHLNITLEHYNELKYGIVISWKQPGNHCSPSTSGWSQASEWILYHCVVPQSMWQGMCCWSQCSQEVGGVEEGTWLVSTCATALTSPLL